MLSRVEAIIAAVRKRTHSAGFQPLVPVMMMFLASGLMLTSQATIELPLTYSRDLPGSVADLLRSQPTETQALRSPKLIKAVVECDHALGTFRATVFVYVMIAVFTFLSACCVIAFLLATCKEPRFKAVRPLGLLALFSALVVTLGTGYRHWDLVFTWPGIGEYLRSIDLDGSLRSAIFFTKASTTMGFLAAFSLVGAASVSLLPISDFSDSALQRHRFQARVLELTLFTGALLLAMAVIRDRTFFEYAAKYAQMISPPGSSEAREALEVVGRSVVSLNGLYFSGFLMLVWFPPSLLMNSRTDEFAQVHTNSNSLTEVEAWRKEIGLDSYWKGPAAKVMASFAPALAGGLGDVITIITGGGS